MSDEPVRKGSRARIVLFVLAALVAISALAVVLGYRRLVTWYVIRACRARGVMIEPQAIEASSSLIRLRDTRFTLAGVPSLGANATTIEVALQRFAPVRVDIHGLSLELAGPVAAVTGEVGDWMTAQKASAELPLQADGVDLTWRDERKAPAWMTVQKAILSPEPGGKRIHAPHVWIAGTAVKQVSVSWKLEQPDVAISIGADDPASAPIRIELTRRAPYFVKVAWKPLPLIDLATQLGITMQPRGILTDGNAELRWSDPLAPMEGSVHLVLEGFVPPHPAELNAIVTGTRTVIDSKLSIPQDRSRAGLSEVKIVAGSLQLDGTGQVQRVENYGLIGLKLTGTIPCTSIAKTAMVGRLGTLLGGLVGDLAQRSLIGVITVNVSIDADTRNLGAARVEDRVGIGCKLRLL